MLAHVAESRGLGPDLAPLLPFFKEALLMSQRAGLAKTKTGTEGLDEILEGGLPKGRPTLVAGAAGCGKTLLGMQFLVRGALDHGEPGVFISFEERVEDLHANVASLGFDLADLEKRNLLSIDHIHVDPSAILESGEYDLMGLFLRLGFAIDAVGAKRVVIDTLEALFGGLSNYGVVRSELRRLFEWLKERGVTAIITAERGDNALTRHGLEEYVSDCVIALDHRVEDQVSTRRLRVVKYRGSVHGTNEYPFLIDEDGIVVLPITSAGLTHEVVDERVSTGVPQLDIMLGGGGYYKGSTILLSGTAGGGKTSLAAHFADATCRAGGRALYFSFEESPHQVRRNMQSIGLDLGRWLEAGSLRFVASRPTAHGLEAHLAVIHKHIQDFSPEAVIIDPASSFLGAAHGAGAQQMLVRLTDHLKRSQITVLMTTLTHGERALEQSEVDISSIVDTWLLLKTIELAGERNRGLYVLKSRGMAHSNQIREFNITPAGIQLTDVYVGLSGVLTGSARAAQEARERDESRQKQMLLEQKRRRLEHLQALHREQIAKLAAEYENESSELRLEIEDFERQMTQYEADRSAIAKSRGVEQGREL